MLPKLVHYNYLKCSSGWRKILSLSISLILENNHSEDDESLMLFVNQEMAPLSKWKKNSSSSIAKIKRPINYGTRGHPFLKKNSCLYAC